MTDSTDVQLAVAIAEIERLRAEDERLRNSMLKLMDERAEFLAEIDRLRALTHGTLTLPRPEDAPPAVITANHPPSAPPHNE